MKIFHKRSFWVMLTIYMALWLAIITVANTVMETYKNVINNAFGLTGIRTETISVEGEDLEYFKSDFVKKDVDGNVMYTTDENGYRHQVYDDAALRKASLEKANQIQREGSTMLWNSDTNGLPLAEGKKVSLFSHSSVDWGYSGGGSGAARLNGVSNMKEALTAAGLSVNPTLWDFYKTGAGSSYVRQGMLAMNEVPWSVYTDSVKNSFSSYGDAAIIVFTRKMREASAGGAQADVTQTAADTPTGDYLDLSIEEEQMVDQVIAAKKAGVFKKVIVLINTPASIFMDSLVARKDDIDCCMWVGQTGFQGLNEIGNILAGKSIPSGHLADTFMMDTRSAPAYKNSVASMYTNARSMGLASVDKQGVYIAYAENIYVGYKYYETRYEDAVLGRGNATSAAGAVNVGAGWRYSDAVAFPFGHGDAYTTFAYSNFKVEKNADGDYDVTLTVENTGSKNGLDAVQVYVQRPYTDYDKQNGVEQAAVNLAGYKKTSELKPGEKENVTITVRDDAFKTYDAQKAKTYIREKTNGSDVYYMTVAQDAHEAINNILAKKGKTPANTNGVMDAEGNVSMVETFEFATDDFETYSVSEKTGEKITNQFDVSDWNKYENKGAETITYLSRNDWNATYPKETVTLSMTEAMAKDVAYDHDVVENPEDEMPLYGQTHTFNLIDLKGYDFNHSAWDTLLNQLTFVEQVDLLRNNGYTINGIGSIAMPTVTNADGPLGLKKKFKNSNEYTLSYPSPTLLAASYNDQLALEFGELMGEDALHAGIVGIFAPGANTHRTAYAARNWEYHSEDGFLGGMMSKWRVIGMQSKGCHVNLKHFALNDQESYRHGVSIWVNEQAMREIYLASYEYSVTEGDCTGIMSSFNRIGASWSGAHKGMCTNVLRNEWGLEGFVLTDGGWQAYMGVKDGLMGGNDCLLGNGDISYYTDGKTNATLAKAIRESVHRILYVIANGNAMNGISSNTKIYEVDEWWQVLVDNIQLGTAIATGVCLLLAVVSFIIPKKKEEDSFDENVGRKIRLR